jgi:hypothetical protein
MPKSNAMPIDVLDDSWIEHDFQHEDLLGGLLNLYVLMNFSCGGMLSVQLSAMTLREDPEPFAGQNPDRTMAVEAAMKNLPYQQKFAGTPPDESMEGDSPDVDVVDVGEYPDFLGGESLEEYYEH